VASGNNATRHYSEGEVMSTAVEEKPRVTAKPGFRVIVNTAALAGCLELACKPVISRTGNEVVRCILLKAENNLLECTGTNLSTSATAKTNQVQIEHEGLALVNAEMLQSAAKSMDSDTIALQLSGDSLVIIGGSTQYKLPTLKPSSFPPRPASESSSPIVMEGSDLARLLKQCLPAMGDDTKFIMNSINLCPSKGYARFMATDGHMGIIARIDGEFIAGGDIVIPGHAIPSIMLLCGISDAVSIWADETQVTCSSDSGTIIATKSEGSFPPLDDVMLKNHEGKCNVETKGFARLIQKFSVVSVEKSIRFSFTKQGIKADLVDGGANAESSLPCKYAGPDVEIFLLGKWMLSVLSSMPGEEVEIRLVAGNRPLEIESKNCKAIVMPKSTH
jgi:DNA polymerase III beta subunit